MNMGPRLFCLMKLYVTSEEAQQGAKALKQESVPASLARMNVIEQFRHKLRYSKTQHRLHIKGKTVPPPSKYAARACLVVRAGVGQFGCR